VSDSLDIPNFLDRRRKPGTALVPVPTLETLSAELREHFRAEGSARIQAGRVLLELRRRVEAGEAGPGVNWWEWFEARDFGRGRKDAEKLMRIAGSDDPEAALAKEHERVRKSKEKKETADADTGTVEGGVGVSETPPTPPPKPKQFALPVETDELAKKLAQMTGLPHIRILGLALQRGLEILYQEELARQQQERAELDETAVHEAGHAAALFIIAKELGHDPAEAVEYIKINRSGSGCVRPAGGWRETLTPSQQIMIDVAGAVAQAKRQGQPFDIVWHGRGCGIDRPNARRITRAHSDVTVEVAVEKVTAWFADPAVWNALLGLAERLPVGKTPGRQAWEYYSTARVELAVAA
jgi:hypothetical protein